MRGWPADDWPPCSVTAPATASSRLPCRADHRGAHPSRLRCRPGARDHGRDGSTAVPVPNHPRPQHPAARLLLIRDGGCVFPGCDRPPSHCQAHHLKFWTRDHGPTDIDNLALVCGFHHWLIHDKHWTLQALPAGPDAPAGGWRGSEPRRRPHPDEVPKTRGLTSVNGHRASAYSRTTTAPPLAWSALIQKRGRPDARAMIRASPTRVRRQADPDGAGSRAGCRVACVRAEQGLTAVRAYEEEAPHRDPAVAQPTDTFSGVISLTAGGPDGMALRQG